MRKRLLILGLALFGSAQATDLTTSSTVAVATAAVSYAIGDTGPAGGIVFYVDAQGRNGLEAAPMDQSAGISWDKRVDSFAEALGDGVGAGNVNTRLIAPNQGSDSNAYAAGISSDLVVSHAGVEYSDWYLPSKHELNLMWLNIGPKSALGNVGGFANLVYWSSSELDIDLSWYQYFGTGSQYYLNKSMDLGVRSVRAF